MSDKIHNPFLQNTRIISNKNDQNPHLKHRFQSLTFLSLLSKDSGVRLTRRARRTVTFQPIHDDDGLFRIHQHENQLKQRILFWLHCMSVAIKSHYQDY